MNKSEPFIKVQGLEKFFTANGNCVEVLRGIDLEIIRGETVAVVGASGVGKSTLLHVLGTLERPDRGQVLYHGEDVFLYDEKGLASFRNKTIGFVFQFHHLLPEFSALENAMMPCIIQGLPTNDAAAMAEAILVRVGLKDRMKHQVGQLSGGEQQRVAVARALVLKPAVLLADEPTGNLDAKTGDTVHDLLISLNEEDGVTGVIVTHNMRLAERLSRRITLVDGKAEVL